MSAAEFAPPQINWLLKDGTKDVATGVPEVLAEIVEWNCWLGQPSPIRN